MSLSKLLIIWPGSPVVSVLIWIVVTVLLLYLARTPAHRAILSLSRVIHNGLRLVARSVLLAEKRLVQRNKEVLLNCGIESVERLIEREFHRVNAVVKRDFSKYPTLHRALVDQTTRIDEDYHESAELPPSPPSWVKAVEAVAKIPSGGDGTVANILSEIHKTTVSQHKNSMEEYRKAVAERHGLLKRMMPYWRRLTQTLDVVGKTITGLQERSKVIDNRMTEYEEIRAKTDKSARMLTASSLTQFFISGFVLLIAIGGAVINFNLIALPMSEMVGGGSYIGSFKTSNVAALVIILVEVAMGLYLMESLRITRLFPIIGQMDDKMRTRMIWVTFSILLILASVESALAFMRDQIAADMQALRQSLAAVESTAESVNSWIPTVGQMVMGFVLPFALTFVAIPLESFVQSSRTVIGVAGAAMLRWVAFVLRLLGNIGRYLGELLVNLYDLLIFPPLWLENLIRKNRHQQPEVYIEEEVS
ncbi:MAG: hypothetical protein JSU72_06480 [Deltaproteobacteria bacterium]|nr:MAG: hypothetical protein JSU72_06480 [Deltaproteobacteria bacterium]